MNTQIMAVALVAVSMLGVRAADAQAEEVKLVAVVPMNSNELLFSGSTFIVLGKQNDENINVPFFSAMRRSTCGRTSRS